MRMSGQIASERKHWKWGESRELRFWRSVRFDKSGCWLWTASRKSTGHRQMAEPRASRGEAQRVSATHRISWELHRGLIPEGWHVHHLCENPSCCNPSHLVLLSPSEHLKLHHPELTHCVRGHPYDETNTRINRDGSKQCRACDRERQRRIREENRGDYYARQRVRLCEFRRRKKALVAWLRREFVHDKGCPAEKTKERSDCRCNLREPEYDGAWVFRKRAKAA